MNDPLFMLGLHSVAAAIATAADKIDMSIDGVKAAGRRAERAADSEASTARTKVRGIKLSDAAYGPTDGAQAFTRQHNAVQQVFESTLDAVVRDLNEFAGALKRAAEQTDEVDEAHAAMLSNLASSKVTAGAAERAARAKHATALTVPPGADEAAGSDAEDQAETTPPAVTADGSDGASLSENNDF